MPVSVGLGCKGEMQRKIVEDIRCEEMGTNAEKPERWA